MWLSGPCIASIRGSDRTSHDYQVAVAIVACHFALAPGYPHNHFQIPWQHRDLHSAWCKTESLRQTECKKCAPCSLTGHIAEEHSFESALVLVIVSEDNIEGIRKRPPLPVNKMVFTAEHSELRALRPATQALGCLSTTLPYPNHSRSEGICINHRRWV
ncbi:predicted protein [Histoplasma capsulatum H143]|uniref:Uncharacterized protein n=1 Tax=Ajellomyces capsulatus (strain H143) TaxID=544712 RepID=C6H9A8_AJECH|nr:predicted protein [Histoplasma capsulatum H143]